ncbi:Hypothetical predicted protein [Octopus vulgaris]|uniref:Uncharacterized protein n=1 Tax=Octopus vulgaris TaxID=6645 RepID=A0AA36BBP9_OCTVU|nr:Hypothetical predicted protein [Octopus vulgaris]
MLGCLMDGSVEDNVECSGGEIGDFEYDAGIDLGVVVAEDVCGGGIGGCSNGCSGGCEDDSDIDSICIEVVAESDAFAQLESKQVNNEIERNYEASVPSNNNI